MVNCFSICYYSKWQKIYLSPKLIPNYSPAFTSCFALDHDFASARQASLSDLDFYIWPERLVHHY